MNEIALCNVSDSFVCSSHSFVFQWHWNFARRIGCEMKCDSCGGVSSQQIEKKNKNNDKLNAVIHLPGPMKSIISVNGIITQKARMNKHPRRRRGDAVSPIFIVANSKHLQTKKENQKWKKRKKFMFNLSKIKCQLKQSKFNAKR